MAHRAALGRCISQLRTSSCWSTSACRDASPVAAAAVASLHSWTAAAPGSSRQPTGNDGPCEQPAWRWVSAPRQLCGSRHISTSSVPAQDYYKTLGVSKDASDSDIKRAWYKLAKQYHPDTNKAADASAKYHEAQKAYETLSDKQKRSMYDQVGQENWERMERGESAGGGFPGGFPGGENPYGGGFNFSDGNFHFTGFSGGGGGSIDMEDIMEQFFGQQAGRGRGARGFRVPRKKTLRAQLVISFEEAARGVTRNIRVAQGVPKPQNVDVRIPAGIDTGMTMLVGDIVTPTKDNPGAELYVDVIVQSHPHLERAGQDVIAHAAIDMVDAALGTEISVHTLEGDKRVNVREGTQPGDRLRLRGLGFPDLHGSGRGDQYVAIRVVTPRNLTQRQRELLEEFQAAGQEDDASAKAA